MQPLEIFKVGTLAQAFFALGACTVFIYLYIQRARLPSTSRPATRFQVAVISFMVAHLLLILATAKTAFFGTYSWGDEWFYFVGFSYFVSDVAIIIIIRGVADVYYAELRKFKKNSNNGFTGPGSED